MIFQPIFPISGFNLNGLYFFNIIYLGILSSIRFLRNSRLIIEVQIDETIVTFCAQIELALGIPVIRTRTNNNSESEWQNKISTEY